MFVMTESPKRPKKSEDAQESSQARNQTGVLLQELLGRQATKVI